MTESNITREYVTHYIRKITPEQKGVLKELEKYAKDYHVPIVQPEVAQLILVLAKTVQPMSILEVGTAIGYSAILLSQTLKPNGKIISIERYDKMIEQAKQNIEKAGLEDTIQVVPGEAEEILAQLEGQFDYIFIDAAKGKYSAFLPHCLRLLRTGGLLISDNVLYQGMIASDKLVVRRKKTIVTRMRQYLHTISHHPQLESSIIPIGDGVAVSCKIGRAEDE